MAGSFGTLITSNVKTWMSAKGFLLVCMAALIPLILSVAWVGTHRADVAPVDVSWDPPNPIAWNATAPTESHPINFTATIENQGRFSVGAFNATIRIGRTDVLPDKSRPFDELASNSTRIPGLGPGERKEITLRWAPRPFSQFGGLLDVGTFDVLVDADSNDDIGEIEEFNNRLERNLQVHFGDVPPSFFDLPPELTANDANATTRVDVGVEDLTWSPPEAFPNTTMVFTVNVVNHGSERLENVNATIRVVLQDGTIAEGQVQKNLTLEAHANETVRLEWRVPPQEDKYQPKVYRAEAYARVPGTNDTATANNVEVRLFIVDREVIFPEPPERATIKGYYISVVRQLLLPLLLPVIGLYYAAGVLSDERDRGNLVYLLTRPINRVSLPLARFLVSFVIASIAIAIGTLGAFLLILGLHQGEFSYLLAPLSLVILALLAYGAVFTLIGVTFARPYLVGIGFVGWEWLIQVGSQILINNRPVVAPWVQNLTIYKWLEVLSREWSVEKPLVWLPTGGAALDALRNLLIATIVILAVAAYVSRRREFPE